MWHDQSQPVWFRPVRERELYTLRFGETRSVDLNCRSKVVVTEHDARGYFDGR